MMGWAESRQTFFWIFPVGRGNAAFLRTGLNQGFILDMAGGEFEDPAKFIRDHFVSKLDTYKGPESNGAGHSIAQAILSHPHADHIAQCEELSEGDLYPELLTCPHDHKDTPDGKLDWNRIGDSDSEVHDEYRSLYKDRTPPLQTIAYSSGREVDNLEYGIYYVRPPKCDELHPKDDNKYGNATSIVLYLRHGDHSVLFPGDVTPEAMEAILDDDDAVEKRFTLFVHDASDNWHSETCDQPSLGELLSRQGLTVMIAPHHGLESCYSEKLYETIKDGAPRLVIISERRKSKEGDGTTDARYKDESHGLGVDVTADGEKKRRTYLTTVNGHHILCLFSGSGQPRIYKDEDPDALLKVLDGLS